MTEHKYILKAALMHRIGERLDELRDEYGNYDHYTDGYDECVETVEDFPTVDAVEVVRCKDCQYSKFIKSCSKYMCDKCNEGRGELKYSNDFCSDGRKNMN